MIFPWMRLLLNVRQLKSDSDSAAPTMTRVSGPSSAVDPPSSITIIEPRPGWRPIQLAEIWQYRDLLFFLAWRDIKVRYKQTVLGGAWAVIQPLMTMI